MRSGFPVVSQWFSPSSLKYIYQDHQPYYVVVGREPTNGGALLYHSPMVIT